MDNKQYFIYLLIMAGSTYLIRAIPFVAISKKITNRFIKSFLHYIPYTVLTAMTIPAALYATNNIIAAALGLIVAMIVAIKGKGLTVVAALACITVFVVEAAMTLIPGM
ncbi:MAG: AzlD domain-containing protein [Christensenellaceae bacterium]|nr:AzlD domain-containing protein [Christensenellaceae bacterium]